KTTPAKPKPAGCHPWASCLFASNPMIITIDGTSASGKTTAARELAEMLGFELLRTGAMYRALALAAHRAGVDERATRVALEPPWARGNVDADPHHVWLNSEEVTPLIVGDFMSSLSSVLAELPNVRHHVTDAIRRRAQMYRDAGRSFVAEGRDQGSFVFPEAE